MPRTRRTNLDDAHVALIQQVNAVLFDDTIADRIKVEMVADARLQLPESAHRDLDRAILKLIKKACGSVAESRKMLRILEERLEQISAPPLVPARWIASESLPGAQKAGIVHIDRKQRIVTLDPSLLEGDLWLDSLQIGDRVYVTADQRVIVGRAQEVDLPIGEVVEFVREVDACRLLVRRQGDDRMVWRHASLAEVEWNAGDAVRLDECGAFALEKIEATASDEFLVESASHMDQACVGGQRENLNRLLESISIALSTDPEVRHYDVERDQGILLVGPPGTGKTLMARTAASYIQHRLNLPCRISVVKPGAWEHPLVGMTQRKIRECFTVLREGAGVGLLVLDEIEAVGRMRGGVTGEHNDRFLASLLAELQGFDDESGARIIVIGTTNRLDLLDPALAERFPLKLIVDRPNRAEAREIFRIHLSEQVPLAETDDGDGMARDRLIERALTQVFSATTDAQLCTIRFRNAEQRVITARDLISGRCIRQICEEARRIAAVRHTTTGMRGVIAFDIDEAIARTLSAQASTLTCINVRQYITDLPQDQQIVAVERVARPTGAAHRVIRVAG